VVEPNIYDRTCTVSFLGLIQNILSKYNWLPGQGWPVDTIDIYHDFFDIFEITRYLACILQLGDCAEKYQKYHDIFIKISPIFFIFLRLGKCNIVDHPACLNVHITSSVQFINPSEMHTLVFHLLLYRHRRVSTSAGTQN